MRRPTGVNHEREVWVLVRQLDELGRTRPWLARAIGLVMTAAGVTGAALVTTREEDVGVPRLLLLLSAALVLAGGWTVVRARRREAPHVAVARLRAALGAVTLPAVVCFGCHRVLDDGEGRCARCDGAEAFELRTPRDVEVVRARLGPASEPTLLR